MNNLSFNPGSFRDPRGRILQSADKILRLVTEEGEEDYSFVRDSGLYDTLVNDGLLLGYKEIDTDQLDNKTITDARYLLEHPMLDFISYPYEWSFSMLQDAAILQLNLILKSLKNGITLSDASAYNIQFRGPVPVFIDHLSFRRYRNGEYWIAHRQFCEQYLNPLLLNSLCGIAFNNWYRGNMEGISTNELNKIIPFFKKILPGIFFHVTLQSFFQKRSSKTGNSKLFSYGLPLNSFVNLLEALNKQIINLNPFYDSTDWLNYVNENTYSDNETREKHDFICKYVENVKPRIIWDLGCNTGEYSATALRSGVNYSIGFDTDPGALDTGYKQAKKEKLNYLPLYMDMANPSPSQGWMGIERDGLEKRGKPDGLLALAFLHHLVIGRNIPIHDALSWMVKIAPSGIIEFVPKNDEMVKKLLAHRDDIFSDYTQENFINIVNRQARIINKQTITKEGRILVWYNRKQ